VPKPLTSVFAEELILDLLPGLRLRDLAQLKATRERHTNGSCQKLQFILRTPACGSADAQTIVDVKSIKRNPNLDVVKLTWREMY
jgi:hypothetical protein